MQNTRNFLFRMTDKKWKKKERERESEQEAEHRTVRLHLKEQTG